MSHYISMERLLGKSKEGPPLEYELPPAVIYQLQQIILVNGLQSLGAVLVHYQNTDGIEDHLYRFQTADTWTYTQGNAWTHLSDGDLDIHPLPREVQRVQRQSPTRIDEFWFITYTEEDTYSPEDRLVVFQCFFAEAQERREE